MVVGSHLVILYRVCGEEVCDVGELVRVLGEAVHLQQVRELAEHGVLLLAQGPHTRVRVVRRVLALTAKLFAGNSIKGSRNLLNLVTNIDKLQ